MLAGYQVGFATSTVENPVHCCEFFKILLFSANYASLQFPVNVDFREDWDYVTQGLKYTIIQ